MGSPATKDYLRAWERRVVDAIMIGLGRGCKLVWGVDSIWGLRIPHHHPLVPSPDNSGIHQCIGEVWNHVTLQTDSAASRCFSFSASALKPRVSCWLKEPYTFDQLQESSHSLSVSFPVVILPRSSVTAPLRWCHAFCCRREFDQCMQLQHSGSPPCCEWPQCSGHSLIRRMLLTALQGSAASSR